MELFAIDIPPHNALLVSNLSRPFHSYSYPPSTQPQTLGLIKVMTIFNREVRNAGHFNSVSTFVFSIFPWVWNMQTWQILWAWFSAVPVLFMAVFLVMPKSKGAAGKKSSVAPSTITSSIEEKSRKGST